jgi:predicted transcriptional regulator
MRPEWRRPRPGELTVTPFGGRIRCHVCGLAFAQLAMHVRAVHGLSVAAYRRRYRLPPGTRLLSAAMQREYVENPLRVARPPDVLVLDDERHC